MWASEAAESPGLLVYLQDREASEHQPDEREQDACKKKIGLIY